MSNSAKSLDPRGHAAQIVMAPDGETLIIAGNRSLVKAFDLSWVPRQQDIDPRRLRLQCELAAGQVIERGSAVPLTTAAWMERWDRFIAEYPLPAIAGPIVGR